MRAVVSAVVIQCVLYALAAFIAWDVNWFLGMGEVTWNERVAALIAWALASITLFIAMMIP